MNDLHSVQTIQNKSKNLYKDYNTVVIFEKHISKPQWIWNIFDVGREKESQTSNVNTLGTPIKTKHCNNEEHYHKG